MKTLLINATRIARDLDYCFLQTLLFALAVWLIEYF